MSNLSQKVLHDCPVVKGCDAVELILTPRAKDLGGFFVRRALPTIQRRMVGPWVFFDHMGPADFQAGTGIDVRPHPHIHIATVTYLFEGEIFHRDSVGSAQAIRPGDINLMVAGRGIVHSERERPEVRDSDHRLHGLQLWMALPVEHEDTEPAFHHYPSSEIPRVVIDGVPVRVLMGSAFDQRSPVKTFCDTLYVEAELEPGQSLVLPNAEERALYVAEGELRVGEQTIPSHAMAVLTKADGVVVHAEAHTRIALIGGEPLGARFMEWNFVSSQKERVEQAKQDWRDRRFPTVPGDDQEWIPLPSSKD